MIANSLRDKMIAIYKNLNRIRVEFENGTNTNSQALVWSGDTQPTGTVETAAPITFSSGLANKTVWNIVATKTGPSYYRSALGELKTAPDNYYTNIESLLNASVTAGQTGGLGAALGDGAQTAVQNIGYMPLDIGNTPTVPPVIQNSLNLYVNNPGRSYAGRSNTTDPYGLLTKMVSNQELEYLEGLVALAWTNTSIQSDLEIALLCPAYSFTSMAGDFGSNNFRVEYYVGNLDLTYSAATNGRLIIESIESQVINS